MWIAVRTFEAMSDHLLARKPLNHVYVYSIDDVVLGGEDCLISRVTWIVHVVVQGRKHMVYRLLFFLLIKGAFLLEKFGAYIRPLQDKDAHNRTSLKKNSRYTKIVQILYRLRCCRSIRISHCHPCRVKYFLTVSSNLVDIVPWRYQKILLTLNIQLWFAL